MRYSTAWLAIDRFCQMTGLSKDAVKAKRSKGIWPDGFVTRKAPDGNLYINIEQYEKWIERGYNRD